MDIHRSKRFTEPLLDPPYALPFQLSPNQSLLKSFMSPYTHQKSMLIYHQTGQGKTCTSIQIAENFRKYYKKCYVIASKSLHQNFQRQLFNPSSFNKTTGFYKQCTGSDFVEELGIDLKGPQTLIAEQVKKQMIDSFYRFYGYIELANRVEKHNKGSVEAYRNYIEREFSECIFIIDEVHNIRDEIQVKETNTKAVFDDDDEKSDSDKSDSDSSLGSLPDNAKRSLMTIMNILRYSKNSRLILLTATPMIDQQDEILWLMNLIRSHEKQPECPYQRVINERTQEFLPEVKKDIIEFANRHVSFMRGENPNTFPVRLSAADEIPSEVVSAHRNNVAEKDLYGKPIPVRDRLKHLTLVPTVMSKYQYECYKKIVSSDNSSHNIAERIQVGTFAIEEDKKVLTGSRAINAVVRITSKDRTPPEFSYVRDDQQVFAYENLDTYSPKIKRILDIIQASDGISMIYTEYISGGIVPLALALEHIGYSWYTGSNTKRTCLKSTYLAKKNKKEKEVQRSYVILSGDSIMNLNHNISKTLELLNHPDNVDGHNIKVILATRVASEGLDMKNIRQIHFLSPWYNINRMEQVIGRGIRNMSHTLLAPDKKDTCTVFFHTSVVSMSQDRSESYDEHVYRKAEQKQKYISMVERLLKQGAFDCVPNRFNNVRNDMNVVREYITSMNKRIEHTLADEPYQRECDYMDCDWSCVQEDANAPVIQLVDHDVSEYIHRKDVLYDINAYKALIKHAIYQHPQTLMTYEELHSMIKTQLGKCYSYILYYALDDLLKTREPIKVYRRSHLTNIGYLVYIGNAYMIQPTVIDDRKVTVSQRNQLLSSSVTEFIDINQVKKASLKSLLPVIDTEVNKRVDGKEELEKWNMQRTALLDEIMKVYPEFEEVDAAAKQTINDMVWNMLSHADMLRIAKAYVGKFIQDPSIEKSIVSNYQFVKYRDRFVQIVRNDNGSISYYRILENGTLEKIVSGVEPDEIEKILLDNANQHIREYKLKSDTIYGFTAPNRSNNHVFKLLRDEGNSTGTVCNKSSSTFKQPQLQELLLTLIKKQNDEATSRDAMITRIGEAVTKEIAERATNKKSKKILNKDNLCLLIEYVLRRQGLFLHEFEFKLWKKN